MAEERPVSIDKQWARVRARMRREVGESVYRNWLRSLTMDRVDGATAVLTAPTPFFRDRIIAQFEDRLALAWAVESNDDIDKVKVISAGRSGKSPSKGTTNHAESALDDAEDEIAHLDDGADKPIRAPISAKTHRQSDGPVNGHLDPRFTFENFVVGKPNELAYAAARRVAGSDGVPFNPLFLYGGVGLGKTHLMHAIAWEIRRRDPARRVIYLSAEKFMYQFIRALRFKDTVEFKDQFRSVDVLMIDDVQFIGGKDSTQEEFFHTFNALVDQNRQVIISADKSPTDLEGLEERLRSRLGWGLVADIHPTTYELRLGILQSKVEKLGVEIPSRVLEFLAHKITSNVREMEGAMNRIVAHATLVGRDITLETTQEVLHDLLRAYDRRVTVEDIQRQVATHFEIRLADMHSARRSRAVARPRQVAMYLSKHLTQHSLPDIGRRFGGRDHTTVLHAVKRVDELRSIDKQFNDEVDLLRRMLES
ncbi:MAG: chromosomal replication initiator protein DnaA [Alphaproteobacteria bacterium]|jgi:chromosomal replication initiator protein|nr:chromosomal replication initiator protein DnaA [Alphaproteobacteria bacterium]